LLYEYIEELSDILSWPLFLSIITDHLVDIFILHAFQKAPAAETKKSVNRLR